MWANSSGRRAFRVDCRRVFLAGLVGLLVLPVVPAAAEIVPPSTVVDAVDTGGDQSTTESTLPSQELPGTPEVIETSSIIVKVVAGLDAVDQAAVVARNGGEATSAIAPLRLLVVDVPTADLEATLENYRADLNVVSVSLDRTREVESAASDPDYASQWALPQIGWDQVHGEIEASSAVRIAVLDTGVAPIDELDGRLGSGFSAFGTNPTNDVNGHGTEMASIVAAAANNDAGIAGVAYGDVTVLPVQVLDANGEGSDSDIIEGLVWAVDNGADVALMAFSNPGYSPALQDALNYAWSNGVVLVAAAGNDGSTVATYPAGSSKVIGVGGSTASDSVWSYSNQSDAVYLTAPAVGISAIDLDGLVTSVTGTSASAAIVAGAAAVLRGIDGAASPSVIVGRLARNADPLVDGTLGNGRVNLARAAADESTEGVIPMGVTGGGGPVVGPYTAAVAFDTGDVEVSPGSKSEGASSTSYEVTFRINVKSGGSNPSTSWSLSGTATGGDSSCSGDYYAKSGNPTSPSTSTSDIVVTYVVCGDNAAEGNETIILTATIGSTSKVNTHTILDDDTPPTVTSVTTGSALRNSSPLSWTVNFSKAVTGVDASDFQATIVSGDLDVDDANLSVSGSGSGPYTVSVNRLSGQGVVRLDVLDNDSIVAGTLALSAAFTSGDTITFDSVAPTVSIARVSDEFIKVSPARWELTFSEVINGLALGDLLLSVTGTCGGSAPALANLQPQADPKKYQFDATFAGSNSCALNASVKSDATITDGAGNALVGPVTGPTISVDRDPPTTLSITRNNPSPTAASSVSWLVTFSEPVSGVDTADFMPSLLGATVTDVQVSGVASQPSTSFIVTASTGSNSGSLRLDIAPGRTINDRAGNAMNTAFNSGESYTIDRAAPRVTSIVTNGSTTTNASSVSWTVVFSKAVSGVNVSGDNPDFELASAGGVSGALITNVEVSPSGSQPASTFVVTASTGTGSGTLGLNLVDNNSIVDDASQSLEGSSVADGSVSGPTFTLDRNAPAVTSISIPVGAVNPTNASSVSWTVTFSESVTGVGLGVNATDFSTSLTGSLTAGLPSVSGSGSTYTVTVGSLSGEGTIRLDVLDDDSIVDGLSNKLGGTGTGNGGFEGTDSAYTVDKTAPVVSTIQRYDPTNKYSSKQDVKWLVTFSESVSAVDAGDFDLRVLDGRIRRATITAVAPLSGSGPSSEWLVTVDTGLKNGILCLDQVEASKAVDRITDVAGNKIASAYPCVEDVEVEGFNGFIVAKDAPYVLSITRTEAEPNTKADTASWTVVFSEPVGGDQTSDGVTANDFLLASMVPVLDTNGVLVPTLTDGAVGVGIATPVAVNPAPDANGVSRATTWTITGTLTGLNEGQVLLVLKDNDSIVNASEIELRSSISTAINTNIDGTYRSGESYTIDRTAPVLTIGDIGMFGDTLAEDATNRPADVVGNRGVLSSDVSSVTLEYFEGKTIDFGEVPADTAEDGRSTSTWKSVVGNNELGEGWYTVRVSQSDKAGNIGTVEKTFLIDDVKPTISFTTNGKPDSLTNKPTQSWIVEYADPVGPADASGLNGIVCSLNGATYGPCPSGASSAGVSVTSSSAGITVEIDEGCNTFDIRVYDNAGNFTTISWDGLLDTVAPIVTLGTPLNNTYTKDVTPQVTGSGGVLGIADVGNCGFALPNEALGSPSVDNDVVVLKLFEGRLDDADMEVSSSSLAGTFELDLVDGIFNEEIPVVAADAAIASGLPEGWYSVRAEQADAAGNIGYSEVVWFLVDTTKPTVDFTEVKPDAETNETTAPFKFDREDPQGSTEKAFPSDFAVASSFAWCRLDSEDDEDWQPCDGEVTFFDEVTTSSNNEGPHALDVKVVDRAGNESDVETYEWLIDTTRPLLEITSAPTDPTVITGSNATSPSVFGFWTNDPDPDFETAEVDGPAIPSEVEEMLCKLDAGSFMDCDSFSGQMYNPLAIGQHTFRVKSVDGAGNETEAVHTWDIQANRTVLYSGSYLVTKPGTIGLAATITSAADACKNNIEVAFIVKLDGVEKFRGTARSNSSGVATLTTPPTTDPHWPEGVYDIDITIPQSENCTEATDQGSVTVASLGSAATGGGHYTVSSVGRVNFGVSINRVPNSSPAQFRGQVMIQNNGKWRLKGSINNYLKMSTLTGLKGSASGVGTLQWWDASLGETGAWRVVATNVTFSVVFEDNGGKRGVDKFTINNLGYKPEGLTLGEKMFTSSTAQGLKGGDVRIT